MPTKLLSYWDQNRFVSIWLCLWLLAHGWEQTSDNHHKSESKSPRIFFLVFLPYSNSRAEEQLRPKCLTLGSTKFTRNQFYKPYHFNNLFKHCQTHFYSISNITRENHYWQTSADTLYFIFYKLPRKQASNIYHFIQ